MAERDYAVAQGHSEQSAAGQWREVPLGDCAALIRDSVSPSIMGDALYIGLEVRTKTPSARSN